MTSKQDEDIDRCITSLKVIGRIPQNGRVCCHNGELAIDLDDRFQTLRRWLNRSNRGACIQQLRATIVTATELVASIISKKLNIQLEQWTLQQLLKEMTHCQTGLVNLKTTYHEDPLILAKLDVLLDRLQVNCRELAAYLLAFGPVVGTGVPKSRAG